MSALLRRAGWNLADQVLSAATNAALSFLVARAVDARGFGAFAVGFGVFTVLIGVGRGLVGQPLGIRFSAADPEAARDAVRAGVGAVLAVTVPVGLLTAGAGLVAGGMLGATLLAFGLVLPGLVVQDTCRSAFFARARPDLATLNDALWAVVQFGGVAALLATGSARPWSLALVWGAAAAVCAVVGLAQLGAVPSLRGAPGWIRAHRDLSGYLIADFLLGAGALQGGVLLVGFLVGIDDLGAIRAAQVLTGPLGVLFGALMAFGLPEVSRRAADLPAGVRIRVGAAAGAGLFLVSLAWAGALLALPVGVGTALLGDTWAGAHAVLLPVALVQAFAGACTGPVLVVLSLGRARDTFRLTAIEALLVLVALVTGAALGGATGAAWGLCVQQAVLVPLWYRQLVRAARQPVSRPVSESEPRPDGEMNQSVQPAAGVPAG